MSALPKTTTHHEQTLDLKRIEGQIRGVQKMIADERYCVDILTQLHAVVGAIEHIENKILRKHLEGCVTHSFGTASQRDKASKIKEILELIERFRR